VRALEFLARIHDLCLADDGLAFGYYLAAGKAHGSSRNYDSAREMLRAAERYVAVDPTFGPRLAYHRCRLQWLNDEFEPDSADMLEAIGTSDIGLRQEVYLLRAWLHAGLQNYEKQIDDLVSAVKLAQTDLDKCDYVVIGRTLHSLFRIAFEMGDVDAVAAGETVYNALEWTDDIRDFQYLALRALAWDAFLRGESGKAQWMFRDSKAIAPTPAWQVMAHVDRAYVARMNRNEMWAVDELLHAHELARDIVWSSTTGEERQALVTLAALLAPVDMGHAQHYVSTYIRLGAFNLDPTLAIVHDRRAIGFERYASGRVSQVLGHVASAVKAFEAAYAIFDEAGHHFRAALAAQGLAETTKSETWNEVARRHASAFPNSALYARLTEAPSTQMPLLNNLTPMQRQLAAALREGLSMPELSQRFSRSEFTLKGEIATVYEAFGVRDRSGLRAVFAEQGLE
jgi:tetratricopeptide (TPR) repeat protein